MIGLLVVVLLQVTPVAPCEVDRAAVLALWAGVRVSIEMGDDTGALAGLERVRAALDCTSPPTPSHRDSLRSLSTGGEGESETAADEAVCPGDGARCSSLSCAEAYACLAAGNRGLDRDGDGVPCESVCDGG